MINYLAISREVLHLKLIRSPRNSEKYVGRMRCKSRFSYVFYLYSIFAFGVNDN